MGDETRFLLATAAAVQLGCSPPAEKSPQPRVGPACPSVVIAEVAPSSAAGEPVPAANGAVVYVVAPPIVTTKDLVGARLAKAEGRDVLEIDLDEPAAARLRAYSASHVGAQLAFTVDGRVRQVGRVLDPIVGSGLIVDPGDSNEAAALASSLRDAGCAAKG